jgi:hypothetical protein
MKKRSAAHGIATLGIALCFVSPAHAQIEYVRNFASAPNHGAITITGFNNQGEVSGIYNSSSCPRINISHAFQWDSKTGFHDMAETAMAHGHQTTPPNTFARNPQSGATFPMARLTEISIHEISDNHRGQGVRQELAQAKPVFHTFQVTPSGRIQELRVEMVEPPDSSSMGIEINHKGEIIGSSGTAVNFVISAGARPIRYADADHSTSSVSRLYGVNDKGVVLGTGTEYDSKTGETIPGFLLLTPHQIPEK